MSRHRAPVEHRTCAYGSLTQPSHPAVTTTRGIRYESGLLKPPACEAHARLYGEDGLTGRDLDPWEHAPKHRAEEPDWLLDQLAESLARIDPVPPTLVPRIVQALEYDDEDFTAGVV